MKKYLLFAVAGVLSGSIHAAGFQLWESSTTNLGRSFAGAGVVGDDYSSLAYNPAGMSFNSGSGFQLGGTTVGIRSHAEGWEGTPENEGRTNPYIVRLLPNAYGQYQLNDKATVGLGVYSPFGLATDYKNDWFARNHGLLSEITTMSISPAVSYQVSDSVSVGLALNLIYADAVLSSQPADRMLFRMTAHDNLSVGYTLGITYQPVCSTRFGLAYRSKSDIKFEGSGRLTAGGQLAVKDHVGTTVTLPESVIFSAYHELNKKWGLSATARWTRWTRFKTLAITSPFPGFNNTTHENWQNTWFYSLGVDYKYNDALTFRGGFAYDAPAVRSPENRTARIPDGKRRWVSTGISYKYENMEFDLGYAHLFIAKVRAKHGPEGSSPIDIKYDSYSNLVSFGFQYHF